MKRAVQIVLAALLVTGALMGSAVSASATEDGTRVTDVGDTGGGTRVTGGGAN